MSKVQKFLSFRPSASERSLGQSFVEFTILLPVLLIMISGLIEFGFMLNFYLDMIDAAREVARFAADDDALHDATGSFTTYNEPFYVRAWNNTDRALNWGGQIVLNPAADDVIISIFTVSGSNVTARFPPNGIGGQCVGADWGCHRWGNHLSKFPGVGMGSELDNLVKASAAKTGSIPPNTGVVLVEIYYDYNMIMELPWITAFVPNPITLHAYSIMPNSAAEPTPTPEP